jgi:hypothetical protein
MYVLAGGQNKVSVQVDFFTTATPAGDFLAVRSALIQLSTRRIIINLNAAAGVCMFLNNHVLLDHACCERLASAQSTVSNHQSTCTLHCSFFLLMLRLRYSGPPH